jgi:hypothetical protein
MRAMSVAIRQYANGVNKGTLSANVAKVEAKEKELAAAKAAAKVLLIPTASLPQSHHSSACALLSAGFLCERNEGARLALRESILGGRGGEDSTWHLQGEDGRQYHFAENLASGNHEEPGGHAGGSQ